MIHTTLNNLTGQALRDTLLKCCGSTRWAEKMITQHPFASEEDVHTFAQRYWREMEKSDILEAFSAHPMIGANLDELRRKFQHTSTWSENEQAGMNSASEEIILALQQANQEYFARFGYIFIVCATGKTAKEMLDIIHSRLPNDPTEELGIAAYEQEKITTIRLGKL